MSNKHKKTTISFRITDAERKEIKARILASGMKKQDYFVRSCIYNRICVVGKKETIYPLVQTVNALYLQILEMKKAFTTTTSNPDILPSSDEIKELQTEYTNILTALLIFGVVPNICRKETATNNNLNFQFDMLKPTTNSIIVSTEENSVLIIRCMECNFSVTFVDPNDFV